MNQSLTVARSLIIFAFFLAPLAAYLLAGRRAKPERLAALAPLAALVVALVSGLALLGVVNFSGHWPEATQVVWTGVEVDTRQFVIGGAREGALVGWPNGSFTPSLRALQVNGGIATFEVADGSAYIFDESSGTFYGGAQLTRGGEQAVDGYRVRLSSELRASLNDVLPSVVEILDPAGEVLSRFDLPEINARRHRVLPLRALVEGGGAFSPEAASRLVKVGRWAADKRLLLTSAGEARLLGSDPFRVECRLPCRMTLYWAGQRLPLLVRGDAARLGVMFRPPWRVASPLPPPGANGERKLTLTATPRPDDIAFVLPLGHAVYDRRPALTVGKDADGKPVFAGADVMVGSAPPPKYVPLGYAQPRDPSEIAESVTSRVTVNFENLLLHFATVNDLPRPLGVALLLLVAFLSYGAGVLFVGARSPDAVTRWLTFGLSACLWNLLVFRVLLALRFALDPSRLDALTVKGATLSLAGLAVAPGLFLLWGRLRADLNARLVEMNAGARTPRDAEAARQRARAGFVRCLAYLVVLAAVFAAEFYFAPHLWKNPPAPPGLMLALPFALLFVYLFFVVTCVHRSPLLRLRRSLRLLLIAPLRFDAVVAQRGKALWVQLAHEPAARRRRARAWLAVSAIAACALLLAAWLQPARSAGQKLGTLCALAALAVSLLWMMVGLAQRALGRLFLAFTVFAAVPFLMRFLPSAAREIAQEVVALFALCLVPALFWLSLGLLRGGWRVGWGRLVFLAIAMTLLPVFVMPKFLGDMGSAFATMLLFAAVAALLALTPAWRAGIVIACALFGGVLLATVTYRYFSDWLPGAAEVRLVSYWQGTEIERLIPWARATRGGEGLSLQTLRDAYQHGWESKAIAYEGGWWGAGYGSAPAHLSQVRQDTIQFDSLFSFFVAGEHGWVGGLSLLLLFAAPLALVCRAARRTRADYGYAAGALVCAWLFLEAVLHAGMNLGTFPFTGRGMPLVNVNSTSDLLRWLILFAFAAQLLHWRDPDGDSSRTAADAASIISVEPRATNQAAGEDGTVVALPKPPRSRPRRAAAVFALAALPLALVAFSHARLVADDKFPRTFEWAGVLDRIRDMIRDEVLTVDAGGTIKPDFGKLPEDFSVPDGALLRQEILRFNALPLEERLDETAARGYSERIRGVTSVADYDRLVEDLRTEALNRQRDARPGLFRLLPPERQTDGVTVREVGGYRLNTNSAFNSQLSFRAGATKDEIPRVTLSDGQALIGPAWIGGRWIAASAPEPSVPWTSQLARALTVGQNCFGRGRVRPCEAALTIDPSLQESATKFVSEKGRKTYEEVLKLGVRAGASAAPLPPRVALAVLSLSDGATLALGGYPRMTSSPYWQHASGSGEWLPPARWVEQQAPDALRSLYGGDRNFDRLVVGSATKPMLAAAALVVHPRLNDQLKVKGLTERECEVFGISLCDAKNDKDKWHVTPRADWVDFTQYLALSDNRYHVRLGFLSLSDAAGEDVRAAGNSPSDSESLNGGRSAWRKYPQFPAELQFSQLNRATLTNLAHTPLASHLERMFALNPGGKPLGARISFWTKNEADDIVADARRAPAVAADADADEPSTAGFARISPVAPNLRLDGVTSPRDYVSLLLGGRTNLWSNVDLAAAFVTTVTGKPFAAHIVRDERPFRYSSERESFPQTAAKLRSGLTGVVKSGTFAAALGKTPEGARAMNVINDLTRGYSVYAKTGTLQITDTSAEGKARYVSRIVLAVVRWDPNKPDAARSGLVFSLVAEMTEEGNASRWLGQFFVDNEKAIRQLLSKG